MSWRRGSSGALGPSSISPRSSRISGHQGRSRLQEHPPLPGRVSVPANLYSERGLAPASPSALMLRFGTGEILKRRAVFRPATMRRSACWRLLSDDDRSLVSRAARGECRNPVSGG